MQVALIRVDQEERYSTFFQSKGIACTCIAALMSRKIPKTLPLSSVYVVCSQKAVDALSVLPKTSLIYVVGPHTYDLVKEMGFQVKGGVCNASLLSEIIIQDKPSFLVLLTGDKSRPEIPQRLREAGIPFETCQVYETVPNPNISSLLTSAMSQVQWLIFFSPSVASVCLPWIMHLLSQSPKVKVSAIGTTTAQFLSDHGIPVHSVPSTPTPEALYESIYFNTP
jgi:uroporphyrinogen-III synthase